MYHLDYKRVVMKRIVGFAVILILTLFHVEGRAQNASAIEPELTTQMGRKLALSCEMYEATMGRAFVFCNKIWTKRELDKKLSKLSGGDKELIGSFLEYLNGITGDEFKDNLLAIGFTTEEADVAAAYVVYVYDQELLTYTDWLNNGIPSSVTANQEPVLSVHNSADAAVQIISTLERKGAFRVQVEAYFDKDGNFQSINIPEESLPDSLIIIRVLKSLDIKAEPAQYTFQRIGRSISAPSMTTIDIEEIRDEISSEVYLKFDTENKVWSIDDSVADYEKFTQVCSDNGIEPKDIESHLISKLNDSEYSGDQMAEVIVCPRELIIVQGSQNIIVQAPLYLLVYVKRISKA